MKILTRWGLVALVMIGTLALLGCGQKKTESRGTEQTNPPAQPSGETAERGESGETMTPAGTAAGIWDQITAERDKLSAAIQNGQLKDVHHLAFGIRDLVGALAVKANEATPAGATRLNGMVELVNESAAKLDELGDAGNLSGTQAEFAKLEAVLSAIKSATGAK